MKRYDTHKYIRLSTALRHQSELAAVKAQISFGDWARHAFEEKLKRTTGKRKVAA